MAEREGFEPSIPCGMHAFQACALGHYATSPDANCGRRITDLPQTSKRPARRFLLGGWVGLCTNDFTVSVETGGGL